MSSRSIVALLLFVSCASAGIQEPQAGARARDLGIEIGALPTGTWNAITDVGGVTVGHASVRSPQGACTGVTVVFPAAAESLYPNKVPAAVYTGNGYGKAAGFTQVTELGNLEAPIALTNTLSVGTVLQAMVRRCLALPEHERVRSINVVVGETNDGWLNDIRGLHVRPEHVDEAWQAARSGPVEEGAVGAGTGTMCFGYKGGIGTSSRRVEDWTVGVLVQSNFGGELRVDGRPWEPAEAEPNEGARSGDGSCMIVVATDAPLDARNLGRLAKRATFGLARVGSVMSNGSGDYVIAFSTANRVPSGASDPIPVEVLPNRRMTPLFQGVVDATEEAVLNSLFAARTTVGRDGHRAVAIGRPGD